LNTLGVK